MNISTNSWHYRFNAWNNSEFEWKFAKGRYTTCSYIRTTIASAIASVVKCAVLLMLLWTILMFAGSMIIVPIMIFNGINPPDILAIICAAGWIMAAVMLLIVFVNQTGEVIKNIRRNTTMREKAQPNVFVQSIIDKHNKFCTRVTAA